MKTINNSMSVRGNIGKRAIQWLTKYSGQVGFLIVLYIALSLSTEVFMSTTNQINVMRQISVTMYMSCAMTVILLTGGIDLSMGAVMAVAGMVTAYMSAAGISFVLSMLGGLLVGTLCGLINGLLIANTSMPPFIVTYSMQSILRGIVYVITDTNTMRLTSPAFLDLGSGSLGFLPYPVIYMIIIIIITWIILNRTRLGRHMYAIGGNPQAAAFAGINIKRVRTFIYTLSGALAALSGLVLTSRNSSMQPSLGIGMEMDAIAAVVLGGTSMAGGQGTIGGTIIGAFIIGFMNNGLNLLGMSSFYQYIAKGIIILFAIYIDNVKEKRMRLATAKK